MKNLQKRLSQALLGGGLKKHISSMVPITRADLIGVIREASGVVFAGAFTLNGSNTFILGYDDVELDPRVNDTSGVFNPYGYDGVQSAATNGKYTLAFRNTDTSVTYNKGTLIAKCHTLKKSAFGFAKRIEKCEVSAVDNTGTTRGFNVAFAHGEETEPDDNMSEGDIIYIEVLKLD